ncbi:MAG: DNA repair protein RecN [Proteobacteria bacterium]|nr:DNA repair protein RecN [Pseudomonadota bacterium]
MIKSLFIKNYVLIKQLDLDFAQGFHAFTGETGAGKSIIVGALSLILGNRADYSVIRNNEQKCEISAIFSITDNQSANNWLTQQEIEHSGEVECRRVITADGRSKAWINTRPVANASLKQLGSLVVQSHGQHDQIKLNNAKYQLTIIDESADYQTQLAQVADLTQTYQQINQELKQIALAGALNDSESKLLHYQYQELEQLNLTQMELDELHKQQKSLTNAVDTIHNLEQSLAQLDNHGITEIVAVLQNINGIELSEILAMLDEVSINLNEVELQLQNKRTQIEVNPKKLQQVEQRLEQIYQTARKHNVSTEFLYQHYLDLAKKLELNNTQKENREQLLQQEQDIQEKYRPASLKLSKLRKNSAHKFAQQTTKIIQQLGLNNAQFSVKIFHNPDMPIHKHGQDSCTFEVIMNPGQAPQKMSKTASGGELSRIALAIEICKKQQQSASFIFDEVDAGIGGAVAETVGKLMRKLSATQQVFAVTHLPQVAGLAHQHLLVSKQEVDGLTQSSVALLDKQQRIQELARMSGGSTITDSTLQQAKEFMLGG